MRTFSVSPRKWLECAKCLEFAGQSEVCKAASALQVCSEQSSIFRCNIETLGCVVLSFSYASKVCFILFRRLVSRARGAQQKPLFNNLLPWSPPTSPEFGPPSGIYTVSLFNFIIQLRIRISTYMLAIRMRPGIGTSNASQFTRGSEEMGWFQPTR
jgi:hypothetical protein